MKIAGGPRSQHGGGEGVARQGRDLPEHEPARARETEKMRRGGPPPALAPRGQRGREGGVHLDASLRCRQGKGGGFAGEDPDHGRGGGKRSRSRKMPSGSTASRRRIHACQHMKTPSVLETFVGIRVRVELQDGVEIVGILDDVSFPQINLTMVDVVVRGFEDVFTEAPPPENVRAMVDSGKQLVIICQRRQRVERKMDRIFVTGHRIKYVHCPDRVSMAKQLAVADKRIAQAHNMYSRGVRPDKKRRSHQ